MINHLRLLHGETESLSSVTQHKSSAWLNTSSNFTAKWRQIQLRWQGRGIHHWDACLTHLGNYTQGHCWLPWQLRWSERLSGSDSVGDVLHSIYTDLYRRTSVYAMAWIEYLNIFAKEPAGCHGNGWCRRIPVRMKLSVSPRVNKIHKDTMDTSARLTINIDKYLSPGLIKPNHHR